MTDLFFIQYAKGVPSGAYRKGCRACNNSIIGDIKIYVDGKRVWKGRWVTLINATIKDLKKNKIVYSTNGFKERWNTSINYPPYHISLASTIATYYSDIEWIATTIRYKLEEALNLYKVNTSYNIDKEEVYVNIYSPINTKGSITLVIEILTPVGYSKYTKDFNIELKEGENKFTFYVKGLSQLSEFKVYAILKAKHIIPLERINVLVDARRWLYKYIDKGVMSIDFTKQSNVSTYRKPKEEKPREEKPKEGKPKEEVPKEKPEEEKLKSYVYAIGSLMLLASALSLLSR